MSVLDWVNPISGALDTAGNLVNLGMQFEQRAYDRRLQQTMFDREDNAVQRRMADLKAAGLSPTLAAGQGAGAGQAISTDAPQGKFDAQQKAMMVMQGLKDKADITKTDAEAKLLKEQVYKTRAEENYINRQRLALEDDQANRYLGREFTRTQTEGLQHNLALARKHGVSTNDRHEYITLLNLAETGIRMLLDLFGGKKPPAPDAVDEFLETLIENEGESLKFEAKVDNTMYNEIMDEKVDDMLQHIDWSQNDSSGLFSGKKMKLTEEYFAKRYPRSKWPLWLQKLFASLGAAQDYSWVPKE